MKKTLFAILALCSLSFAQTTIFPKTTVFPKTTIFGAKAAAPAVPVVIGSSLTGGASPLTFTLSGSAAINDIVWAFCRNLTPNAAVAYNWTMADSGSNAWAFASTTNTTWQVLQTNNGFAAGVGWVQVTSPLTGGTSTFTITTSVASNLDCTVIDIPAAMGFTALDKIAPNTNTFSSTITSASITPSTTPTLAFGADIWNNANASFNAYGNLMASAATGLANYVSTVDAAIEYRQLAATTAGTATLTISTAAGNASMVLNFK